jgi:hypothetical protein
VLRPKSFAGLFGAAPSIALATLTMATFKEGSAYVSIEGRFDDPRSHRPLSLLRRGLPAAYALPFFGGHGNRMRGR